MKNHLGPTMEQAGYGDRKIIVWDHNRDMMLHRAHVIFDDPEAAKYAWGMGFHWYETWAGFAPMVENVAAVAQAYPDKPLLLTEAAVEKFDPAKLQYWPNGERYGTAIINDLNHGAVGWTDWNILLDQNGGPNHVGNYCFAPVHADTRTGEVIYTPSYWYIGHFSKFIRPGASGECGQQPQQSGNDVLSQHRWQPGDGGDECQRRSDPLQPVCGRGVQ